MGTNVVLKYLQRIWTSTVEDGTPDWGFSGARSAHMEKSMTSSCQEAMQVKFGCHIYYFSSLKTAPNDIALLLFPEN